MDRRWAFLLVAGLVTACDQSPEDPLARAGIAVTQGAAAGYVADEVCSRCHTDLYRTYQEVGMARSFYRPRGDRMIEDFAAAPFYHQASERYYRMSREGERLTFERYQLDDGGEAIHRLEIEVDWILGSGHTSRTYLFQTPEGELYQLPLAWYSQTGQWGMAPGFDRANHLGVERLVRRECMFCHNGFPDVPVGSDSYGEPHRFPTELPEGIGCQRCHGPGAAHVSAAMMGGGEALRSSITHPGRMTPEREMEICYGCHFQPSVALTGVRRFGRATYSLRPSERLADYMVLLDVEQEALPKDQRFEINHHPYRLEQSTCFLESDPGALTCTNCHDPHRKVAEPKRQAHYRDACLSCHGEDACSLDAMGDMSAAAGLTNVAVDDCATCHMPRRRTQDVVQVVMTDHRIQRQPGGPELLAPLPETTPILVAAELIHAAEGISPDLAEAYKASAVARAGRSEAATAFLATIVARDQPNTQEPWLDLTRSLLGQRRFSEAEALADQILSKWPQLTVARSWRAVARVAQGAYETALADLELSLAAHPGRAELLFNQGIVFFALARDQEALGALRQAVVQRPNLPRAWLYLGRVLTRLEQFDEAEQAFRQALRVDPADSQAVIDLGRLLDQLGRRLEARRIFDHGVRHSRHPEEVMRALTLTGS